MSVTSTVLLALAVHLFARQKAVCKLLKKSCLFLKTHHFPIELHNICEKSFCKCLSFVSKILVLPLFCKLFCCFFKKVYSLHFVSTYHEDCRQSSKSIAKSNETELVFLFFWVHIGAIIRSVIEFLEPQMF